MGLLNRMCKYCMLKKGLSGGFYCALTGEHLDQKSDLFKYGCDSSWEMGYQQCPYYEKDS